MLYAKALSTKLNYLKGKAIWETQMVCTTATNGKD
jgi:hypothetical protein